jgi:hypothetical protein
MFDTFQPSFRTEVTPSTTDGGKEVRIRFRLTNTGDRTATETAQAYVHLPAAADEPSKRLAGWRQVTLAPGRRVEPRAAGRRAQPFTAPEVIPATIWRLKKM